LETRAGAFSRALQKKGERALVPKETRAGAFERALQKKAERGLLSDFKSALPAAALMTPIIFGKNYLEQGMKVGIQDRLGKTLDRSTKALKSSKISPRRARIHRAVVQKLRAPKGSGSSIRTPGGNALNRRFAESMGRGVGAATIGFGAGLLQMVLISKLLKSVSEKS
jgi:hypothetical protein